MWIHNKGMHVFILKSNRTESLGFVFDLKKVTYKVHIKLTKLLLLLLLEVYYFYLNFYVLKK